MDLTFRYAETRDLPQIVSTYNSTVGSRMVTADLEPVKVESRQQWFASHDQTGRPLWVIENHGEYAGWMSFGTFYGRAAYQGTAELSLYLEETQRGKGLGKRCLEFALQEAQKRNVHSLLGFIFAHNRASVRLFEGVGFTLWGHLPAIADMGDRRCDLLIFGKNVN